MVGDCSPAKIHRCLQIRMEYDYQVLVCTTLHDVTPETGDIYYPENHIHQMLSYTVI